MRFCAAFGRDQQTDTHIQTHTETDRSTHRPRYICSNKPHLAASDRCLQPAGSTACSKPIQQRVYCWGPSLGQTDGRTPDRYVFTLLRSALRCCLDRCHTCNFIARLYRAIKSQRATVQLHVTNQANMIGYDIHTNSLVLVRVYSGSMGHESMGQMGQFWMGHMGHGSMHFHPWPTCIFTGSI